MNWTLFELWRFQGRSSESKVGVLIAQKSFHFGLWISGGSIVVPQGDDLIVAEKRNPRSYFAPSLCSVLDFVCCC